MFGAHLTLRGALSSMGNMARRSGLPGTLKYYMHDRREKGLLRYFVLCKYFIKKYVKIDVLFYFFPPENQTA